MQMFVSLLFGFAGWRIKHLQASELSCLKELTFTLQSTEYTLTDQIRCM